MHDDSTHVPNDAFDGEETAERLPVATDKSHKAGGDKVRAMLRAKYGEEVFGSWFHLMEFDNFDGRTVRVSFPTKFLQSWIQSHYTDGLLQCCRSAFQGVERLEVVVRELGSAHNRAGTTDSAPPSRLAKPPTQGQARS